MKTTIRYIGKKDFLQIKPNSTHKKFKAAAHKVLADHPVSQTHLNIFPICTLIILQEAHKLHLLPV
jgi:hypothetical protein